MVGTSVRDRRYEASMAKTTASANGTNRNLATPVRKNMGTKTMQMHSVETKAGTAICDAPSRMACFSSLPMARLRSMFSISTVASSTNMPTASASPPRVIRLKVWPRALSVMMEQRMESGMEMAMTSVVRQLPRNKRIMPAVRQAAVSASRTTPWMAARTNRDWSNIGRMSRSSGICRANFLMAARTLATMSSVEVPPFLVTVIRVPRNPSWRTMLVCGEKPSRTWATSRR